MSSFPFWICSPVGNPFLLSYSSKLSVINTNRYQSKIASWIMWSLSLKTNRLIEVNQAKGHKRLWPPHAKSWLIGKDSDAGRDWEHEEKETTEDEMAGWHHWLDGCESEWTLGDGDGQGGLACCDSWGCKESDMTERLNWTELNLSSPVHKLLNLWSIKQIFLLMLIFQGSSCYSFQGRVLLQV